MIGKDTASNDTITDDEVLIMDAVINGAYSWSSSIIFLGWDMGWVAGMHLLLSSDTADHLPGLVPAWT